MKTVSLKCENCGATLEVDDNRESCFCLYCGSKILIPKDETVHRIVDEARLKEIEYLQNRLEYLQNKEAQDKQDAQSKRKANGKAKLILLAAWLVVVIALFILSSATADNVGFSPYQLLLIPVFIVGVIIAIKEVLKFFKNS